MTEPQSSEAVETICVAIGPHITSSLSDLGWEHAGPSYIALWCRAQAIFGSQKIEINKEQYHVEVDLSPAIRNLKRSHYAMETLELHRKKGRLSKGSFRFPKRPAVLEFHVTSRIADPFSRSNHSFNIIEYYLFDIFIVMNLSYPGSFDLYSGLIKHANSNSSRLRLSSYHFESALMASMEGKWPQIGEIPIKQVADWYYAVRPEIRLVGRNRTERAIFAILHLNKSEITPVSIVWIFYALESLFDTKVGENFRSLVNRIALLLKPNAKELASLKKSLRNLYDLRSAFVHGGFEIVHPTHNEVIDRSVDDQYYKVMDAVDFGFRTILASIQEIIRRGWIEAKFQEVLSSASTAPET